MIEAIHHFFERHIAGGLRDEQRTRPEFSYQRAAAALLFEVSRADYDVKTAERLAVADAVRRAFALSEEETEELLRIAEAQAEESISLYEFTRLINEHFSLVEKERLVEMLWQVAYADGDIDKYEEYLVRKIADLVYLPHSSFIQAKLRARERAEQDQRPA